MSKEITLESLAHMCQTEFSSIHDEFKNVHSKLEEHDNRFDTLHDELKGVRTDMREIKMTRNPFVRAVAEMQEDVQQLQSRVHQLEQKAGI